MTRNYAVLFTLSCLFLFTACEKETLDSQLAPTIQVQKISSAIVFQYAYIDDETEQEYGWFVNQKGEVKSYSTRIDDAAMPKGELCHKEELKHLNLIANTIQTTIEEDELKTYFDFIKAVDTEDLSALEMNEELTGQYTYYAYQKTTEISEEDRNADGCSGSGCAYASTTFYERILLERGGTHLQNNTSHAAVTILEWLKTLEKDIEL